jgi:hypothetical protein
MTDEQPVRAWGGGAGDLSLIGVLIGVVTCPSPTGEGMGKSSVLWGMIVAAFQVNDWLMWSWLLPIWGDGRGVVYGVK